MDSIKSFSCTTSWIVSTICHISAHRYHLNKHNGWFVCRSRSDQRSCKLVCICSRKRCIRGRCLGILYVIR
ncbi:hypothetical protein AR158_c607L [Paramecium bursaria Chlorella virus AR158]|uniref:hypothetical protein n=1 Tax=Paramecium bursaria Chlorella virus AR158 TaxID=380598 RepID=UPI00015AA7C8|nr:hypothetical protein AR158_c607L [Paramecium bursaria Chlorella virus AR158]ABU44152.1 hypothetical protein AR158_c607L [Paramecium bursaria Chlorella virus AR158]